MSIKKKSLFFLLLFLFLWSESSSGQTLNWIRAKSIPSAAQQIVLLDSILFVSNGSLFFSTDNGDTWQKVAGLRNSTSIRSLGLCGNVINVKTSTEFSDRDSLFQSFDTGKSWIKSAGWISPGVIPDEAFELCDNKEILSVGFVYPGISISVNNGKTWLWFDTGLYSNGDSNAWIYSATLNDSSILLQFVLEDSTPAKHFLKFTSNLGKTWENLDQYQDPKAIPIDGAIAIEGDTIFASSEAGIYRTTDRGLHWTGIHTFMPVWYIRGDTILGIFANQINISLDQGTNWIPIRNLGIPNGFDFNSGILVVDKQELYLLIDSIVDLGGGVSRSFPALFRTALPEHLKVISDNNQTYDLEVHPNPFSANTTFDYSIPTRSFVRVMLFDELGREAAQIINSVQTPGMYHTDFDGANIPTGNYTARLTSGAKTISRKVIIER